MANTSTDTYIRINRLRRQAMRFLRPMIDGGQVNDGCQGPP